MKTHHHPLWKVNIFPCINSYFSSDQLQFTRHFLFSFPFLSFISSHPTTPLPTLFLFSSFLNAFPLSICFQYELEFKCPTYCHFLTTRDNFINQNLGRHYYLPFNLGFNIPPSHVERHKETSHPHTWKNIKRQGKGNSNLWPVKSSFDIILNYQFFKKLKFIGFKFNMYFIFLKKINIEIKIIGFFKKKPFHFD